MTETLIAVGCVAFLAGWLVVSAVVWLSAGISRQEERHGRR